MAVKLTPASIKKIQNTAGQMAVPVLATYNTDGKIKPIQVRINGNAYSILSYYRGNSDGLPIEVYRCTVNDNGISREISLIFHPNDTIWTLKR